MYRSVCPNAGLSRDGEGLTRHLRESLGHAGWSASPGRGEGPHRGGPGCGRARRARGEAPPHHCGGGRCSRVFGAGERGQRDSPAGCHPHRAGRPTGAETKPPGLERYPERFQCWREFQSSASLLSEPRRGDPRVARRPRAGGDTVTRRAHPARPGDAEVAAHTCSPTSVRARMGSTGAGRPGRATGDLPTRTDSCVRVHTTGAQEGAASSR